MLIEQQAGGRAHQDISIRLRPGCEGQAADEGGGGEELRSTPQVRALACQPACAQAEHGLVDQLAWSTAVTHLH